MTCPACIKGSLDDGTPLGQDVMIGGVPCYLSTPSAHANRARLVILGSDVFGYRLPNLRLVADVFADHGYIAVAPDYLRGPPIGTQVLKLQEQVATAGSLLRKAMVVLQLLWVFLGVLLFQLRPWMKNHPPEHAVQVVVKLVGALKQRYKVQRVVYQGYCYGGKVGLLLAAQPEAVDAVSVAHPGAVVGSDFLGIQVPILACCAAVDPLFFPGWHVKRLQQVLRQKKRETGLFSRVVQHSGTLHGYALRANKNDPKAVAAREDALQQALRFFEEAEALPAAAAAVNQQ